MGDGGVLSRILEELDEAGIARGGNEQREMLETFVREVVLWSGRIHLIGKSNIRSTIGSLVVDSWVLYRTAREGTVSRSIFNGSASHGAVRVADIGSGAGFPGIVWKIADPGLDVTLYERREKSLRFLERVVALLKVEGLRAEGVDVESARGIGPFDIVLSKAAGRLPSIVPVVERLLRNGGAYLTVKGGGWKSEVARTCTSRLRLASAEEITAGRGTVLVFIREGADGRSPLGA